MIDLVDSKHQFLLMDNLSLVLVCSGLQGGGFADTYRKFPGAAAIQSPVPWFASCFVHHKNPVASHRLKFSGKIPILKRCRKLRGWQKAACPETGYDGQ